MTEKVQNSQNVLSKIVAFFSHLSLNICAIVKSFRLIVISSFNIFWILVSYDSLLTSWQRCPGDFRYWICPIGDSCLSSTVVISLTLQMLVHKSLW